jgi:hypothetical protein
VFVLSKVPAVVASEADDGFLGRKPVSRLNRVGAQNATWQQLDLKSVLLAASLSLFEDWIQAAP